MAGARVCGIGGSQGLGEAYFRGVWVLESGLQVLGMEMYLLEDTTIATLPAWWFY